MGAAAVQGVFHGGQHVAMGMCQMLREAAPQNPENPAAKPYTLTPRSWDIYTYVVTHMCIWIGMYVPCPFPCDSPFEAKKQMKTKTDPKIEDGTCCKSRAFAAWAGPKN